MRLRVRNRGDMAAAAEQQPLGARLDDDVGDQPGELDVVGADGEQHEIEARGRRGACARSPAPRSAPATCARDVVEQAVLVPGFGHSVMRCEPRKPAAMVAPEQASGMKVTAMRGFSIARPSAARIW